MGEIAIVGMACRFPGASSTEAYWRLLLDGVEAVGEPKRPELEPPAWLVEQAPSARRGGYLDEIDRFEPSFFRISPREAACMDPQQRLLLEIAWEALEDAGQPVARLAGTSTGVFVGLMNADFARLASRDPRQIDAQVGPGSALGIAPNRISFALDLRGPSLAIDTLCSSSLVAIHQACLSLLADESSPVAIAGGVNAILDRTMDVFYTRAGLLSKEGRCRAFDANAAGIVRGEGCGLVVLKKLARALADGDRIHAVIRGSAVNQDGRSNGLTAPNRFSQEAVLRAAYARAGLAPSSVAYIEAHGTGTLIGDPIEAAALGAVIGDRDAPCPIGSVKSNLGHLESAAGVASLIKTVLALHHRTLPPSLHVERANPYLKLDERNLRVVTKAERWSGELVAGVSSFGMGGTNAHVVLGGIEPPSPRSAEDAAPRLIPLSAWSPAALDALEARVVAALSQHAAADIAHTLGSRRDHHDHRRAFVVGGTQRTPVRSGAVGRRRSLTFVVAEGAQAQVEALRAIGIVADEHVGAGEVIAMPSLHGAGGEVVSTQMENVVVCVSPFDRAQFLDVVGQLYCLGFDVDWRQLDAPDARFVSLGAYPWQRERIVSPFLKPGDRPAQTLLVPSWVRADVPANPPREGTWCVVGDHAVSAKLVDAGQRLVALDEARHVVVLADDLASVVRIVQRLATRDVRLFLVTRGACVVDGSESLEELAASMVWGFGRVVMNEHPQLRCTLIDVDGDATLVHELLAGDDSEVALRGEARYVARLSSEPLAAVTPALSPDGAYLITGGLGGLGLAAARLLVERGARHLVLLGRNAPTEAVRAELVRLAVSASTDERADGARSQAATITVERADVADREALAAVLARHRLRGVIHAAGVMTPTMVGSIDPDTLRAALAAKVDGARNLHELTGALDFFILYSSIATLLGMPGQGAYAAGNAYLDALAAYRRARGLQATSIAWSVIEGTGMAARAGTRALAQLRERGVEPMTVERASAVLERLLADPRAHVSPMTFDLSKWTRFYPQAATHSRLQSLVEHPGPVPRGPAVVGEPRTGPVSGGSEPRGPETVPAHAKVALEPFLVEAVASVLGDAAPDPRRPLEDLGMDSLAALELRELLKAKLGIELPTDQRVAALSIHELANRLAAPSVETAPTERRSPGSVEAVRDDAHLDPALRFTPGPATPPREILLTGATGFLGAFVLAELLERTQATVHCLVRGADAMARLERGLDRYGVAALDLADRVRIVPGDLGKPRLGLAASVDHVDTIIHNGASVNFVYPYAALKADNVDGTHEILRLASAIGARLHYVSTIGVFPAGPAREPVFEHDRSPSPEHLALGYMRAKWVAEQLVEQARERGLAVSIYRPGTISSHSISGAFNPDDFVCALIKGCIQLGVAPRVDVPVNLAPVDYVSKALVRLALDHAPGTYHLVGREAVPWGQLVDWVRTAGYRLDELPYPAWRALLRERAVPTKNALAPLLPLFVDHEDTGWLQLPSYDDARARTSNVVCPAIDASYLRRSIERFVVSGYLPRRKSSQ